MKRFIDLKINDYVYLLKVNHNMLGTKDQYGNIYDSEFIKKIKVESISMSDGQLLINKRSSYHSSNSCLIDPQKLDPESFKFEKEEYIFYLSDPSHVKNIVREAAVSLINEIEASIPEMIEKKNQQIRDVRKKYHNYLNS